MPPRTTGQETEWPFVGTLSDYVYISAVEHSILLGQK